MLRGCFCIYTNCSFGTWPLYIATGLYSEVVVIHLYTYAAPIQCNYMHRHHIRVHADGVKFLYFEA